MSEEKKIIVENNFIVPDGSKPLNYKGTYLISYMDQLKKKQIPEPTGEIKEMWTKQVIDELEHNAPAEVITTMFDIPGEYHMDIMNRKYEITVIETDDLKDKMAFQINLNCHVNHSNIVLPS